MLRRLTPISAKLLQHQHQHQHQHQPLRHLATKPSPHHNRNHTNENKIKRAKSIGTETTIHFNKGRGQHILTNPRVLDAIVREAGIKPTDTVLEIGPGTGNLTLRLLQVAKKVVAIEIDQRMIEILNTHVLENGVQDRITIICKDALRMEFPPFDLVVANIPYGISSPLIAKIVFGANTFRSATLLLQKEFAHRLLAKPGDSEYNRLAVNVKLVADAEFVMNVSKRDFVPSPRVDSSVVKIRPKAQVPDVDMDEWWAFTRTCFNKKNKTLGATFKQKKKVLELIKRSQMFDEHVENGATHCSHDDEEDEEDSAEDCSLLYSEMEIGTFKDKIIGVLKEGGFEDKRPSKLSNVELLLLLSLFNQVGIHFHQAVKGKSESNAMS